jgi:hypothetical protein
MIKIPLENIDVGTKVRYSLFSNITFEGTDGKHVILKDKYGNKKKVFKELFFKYGEICEVES